jgi:hypothetical protein
LVLSEDVGDDSAGCIGQSVVAAGVAEGETLGVEAEQMEQRRNRLIQVPSGHATGSIPIAALHSSMRSRIRLTVLLWI